MSALASRGRLDAEATVIDQDGERRRVLLAPDEQVAAWAALMHAGAPGLIEFVCAVRRADGGLAMRSRRQRERFPRAGDVQALVSLAARQRRLGDELFATPLPRARSRPGLGGAVLAGQVAWVDIDDAQGIERLRGFCHRPQLVVLSGSGGCHAYWRLEWAVPARDIEALNRRLAFAVGGDLASSDRARIMRLPGSFNGRAGRPCRIAYLDLAAEAVKATTLGAGLADPAPPPPPPSEAAVRRRGRWRARDPLARIGPPDYFRALAGIEVPASGGFVLCPFHREEQPSLMVYPTAERGWRCYGACRRGGTVYDFASLLDGGPSGRALRGEEFKRVKRRVHEALGHPAPAHATANRNLTEGTKR